MKTIEVNASGSYRVIIGNGIISAIGHLVHDVTKAKTVCIVSDSNVWPLYGQSVADSLERSGLEAISFVFPAGENSKNSGTFLELLNFLAENKLTRADCILALGGGVVGDLAGFTASCYLRGIAYIQMPTTLLAAVDSSVGGKTAIDLPAGKNLVGSFYQPKAVLCDLNTLRTLPEDIFRDGCAEVIKYGVLYDESLFSHLELRNLDFDQEAVITRCVELKRDVVAQDEFDTGARMKLNLGHTIGHSIEAHSNFTISHGKAVAIGMAMAARASGCIDARRIQQLLEAFGLPIRTDISDVSLYESTLSDKKRSGGTINLIIPRAIGHCDIVPTPIENILPFIKAGL